MNYKEKDNKVNSYVLNRNKKENRKNKKKKNFKIKEQKKMN